jgi:hypothetical protein
VTATIAVPPHGEERGQDKTEDAPHGRINTATRRGHLGEQQGLGS